MSGILAYVTPFKAHMRLDFIEHKEPKNGHVIGSDCFDSAGTGLQILAPRTRPVWATVLSCGRRVWCGRWRRRSASSRTLSFYYSPSAS